VIFSHRVLIITDGTANFLSVLPIKSTTTNKNLTATAKVWKMTAAVVVVAAEYNFFYL